MDRISWIFFDIGSTLVDESECYRARVMEMIRGSDVTYEEFTGKMLSYYKSNGKGDRLAAAHYGVTLPEWNSDLEILYPEARECLERLHGRYRLGIIANQNPGTAERLKKFGISGFFDVIVASAEEGVAKPDPAIFLLALKKAVCRAEDAVMIGDRLDNDIAPAKALGMRTIRVLQGYGRYCVPTCKAEMPDYSVSSLSEICRILKKKRCAIQ